MNNDYIASKSVASMPVTQADQIADRLLQSIAFKMWSSDDDIIRDAAAMLRRLAATAPAVEGGVREDALMAGRAVLWGEGDGTYDEAVAAIEGLVGVLDALAAPVSAPGLVDVERIREAVLFTIRRLTVLSDARAKPLTDAIVTLVLNTPAALTDAAPSGVAGVDEYAYDELWQAIADSTRIEGGCIAISVVAFRKALRAITTPTPPAVAATGGDMVLVPRDLLGAACHCVRKHAGADSETYKRLSERVLSAPAPSARGDGK